MNKKDQNKVVREKLMTQKDVVFTCGIKDCLNRIQEFRVHGHEVTDEMSYCIIENNNLFGKSMNVKKFGPTCITLYTFDMLGKKTIGKIKYEDVTIVDPEVEESNPLKKIQEQVTINWNSKSSYDSELMFNVNSNNPVITVDEYFEMNNLHAEFEEGCEKLGYKLPYNK